MADLNARERKHVHMSSSIFDAKGPPPNSLYEPGRQQELYANLKNTFAYTGHTPPPSMDVPSPAEMKFTQNAGSSAVLPSTAGYGGSSVERKDQQFMPKEFWSTSVDLQWHDVRNERCRDKSHALQRETMDAKEKKRNEFSSEIFNQARNRNASTTAANQELMADDADYLRVDSSLHAKRNGQTYDQDAGTRFQANLATSNQNTMPKHSAIGQAPVPSPGENVVRGSGGEMRNYSDLFGAEMGRCQAPPTGNRENFLDTRNCSFLDSRAELASRKRDNWRDDQFESATERKEAEIASALFERESPRKVVEPAIAQVEHVERGIWESKECLQISSEISRRRREKDFLKDFDGEYSHPMTRKQGVLSSNQVRRNLGAAQEPEVPSPNTTSRLSPRPSARLGPKPSEREELLRSAKDTKLASLQSSIFS
eukprot:CAMPEP_0197661520 /NCGR_PEP_ID=MMETSP1338-20131121/51504_1 /TAXON_ID=43686 ORGANISM="Pelagodinium beii, Strain RCC1491" /NCGR_SAMPLE_ID=MMETSP1338 /ASSEMBLY_ACC=CAM_ASM_000754 /LENGTH=425 /DNA_ID=CAMNT_0043239087 /DNA_START=30 /DNA_END=1307 /DNA_ORIENTATION=+